MKGPLTEALTQLQKKDTVSFHTPGHKNGRLYQRLQESYLPDSFPDWDTTEIPGTDSLHNPKGVIRDSQKTAADLFGADETFYLVNGSTCGIYSMIMAATKPGDELIVQRNSHQSVFHGCLLGGVTPRYLMPEVEAETGMILGVNEDNVQEALDQWPETKGVLLTTPNYYGITSNIKAIVNILHEKNKPLLVDEAHGSHFILDHRLPTPALKAGADLVVQSTHKTLPALTQASMLHVQGSKVDREKLRWMLRMHQSSSPSYLLMASLDATVALLESHGASLMKELLEHIDDTKTALKEIPGIALGVEASALSDFSFLADPTRLWINLHGTRLTGYEWNTILAEKHRVMMELADPLGVLALASIGNEKRDFDRLVDAIKSTMNAFGKTKFDRPVKHKKATVSYYDELPIQRMSLQESFQAEKEKVELENAVGRICGESLTPYPPGIPAVMPGEEITESLVKWLRGRQEFAQKQILVVK